MCQAAHLFALVCGLHSLFERAPDTVNLMAISDQLEGLGRIEIDDCDGVAKKIAKLRHNYLRTDRPNYWGPGIFKLAQITPNEMDWLAARAATVSRLFPNAWDCQSSTTPRGGGSSKH